MSEEWKNMADWSDLPDVYVTKVECQQGMFWRVEACSVPMAIGPECRLIRADIHDAHIADLEAKLAASQAIIRGKTVTVDHDLERQLAEAEVVKLRNAAALVIRWFDDHRPDLIGERITKLREVVWPMGEASKGDET